MVITNLCDLRTAIEGLSNVVNVNIYRNILKSLASLEKEIGFGVVGYCGDAKVPIYKAFEPDCNKCGAEDCDDDYKYGDENEDKAEVGWYNEEDDDEWNDEEYDDDEWNDEEEDEDENVEKEKDEDDTVVFQTKKAPDGTVYIKKVTQVNNDVTANKESTNVSANSDYNVPSSFDSATEASMYEEEAIKPKICNTAFQGVINEADHTIRFKNLRDMFENADRRIEDLKKEFASRLNVSNNENTCNVQESSFESVTDENGVTHVKTVRNDNGNVRKEEYKLVPGEDGNIHKVKVRGHFVDDSNNLCARG